MGSFFTPKEVDKEFAMERLMHHVGHERFYLFHLSHQPELFPFGCGYRRLSKFLGSVGDVVFGSGELAEGNGCSIMVPFRISPFRLCSRCSKACWTQNRKRSNS
jgi:hypothetical protein